MSNIQNTNRQNACSASKRTMLACLLLLVFVLPRFAPDLGFWHSDDHHHEEECLITAQTSTCHITIYHKQNSDICAHPHHLVEQEANCAFCDLHLTTQTFLVLESIQERALTLTLTDQLIVAHSDYKYVSKLFSFDGRGPPYA